MTNSDIIKEEALANGIYTNEQIESFLQQGRAIPLHTYALWKSMGYIVKRGEHAAVTTQLWRMTSKKKKKEEAEKMEVDGEGKEHYFLTKAFLFKEDQVSKMEG